MFAELGAPIFDADDAVRDFYAGEGAKAVEAAFPGVVVSGQVDRERLGRACWATRRRCSASKVSCIPAVAEARARFLARAEAAGRRLVGRRRAALVRDRRAKRMSIS